MPLWSNEEWRARIGSSWCALGRLKLRRVTQASDCKARQNQSSHFHKALALTLCFKLAWVLKSWLFNWKSNPCTSTQSHYRNVWKSLKAVLLTIFVVILCLLLSGDIEVNPGPGRYADLEYNSVDASQLLVEDDLSEVMDEVVSIKSAYYSLGRSLGLPAGELNAVRRQCPGDVEQALNDILLLWLQQKYNVIKYGVPSWRMLVKAVDKESGGNNHAVAKRIASNHPFTGGNTTPIITRVQEDISHNQIQPAQSGSNICQRDRDNRLIRNDSEQRHSETAVHPTNGLPSSTPRSSNHNRHQVFRLNFIKSWLLMRRCRQTFANFYLRQITDDRAWPPVKETNYINLAVIKDETSWRKTVQQSVDDIIGVKEQISYDTILNEMNTPGGKLYMFEGRPGSGKTTLMNKIYKDWASRIVLKSKMVLIFVPLRRLNAEPDHSLATIIRVACPSIPHSDLDKLETLIEQRQGKRFVFALDGLDEYIPVSKGRDEIQELLHKRSLMEAIVIVSSRPAACTYLREYAERRFEVLGFLKPQIFSYFDHYFDDKKRCQKLITHLQHHPNLLGMCYLPLHCAMLTFLYEEVTLPETETDFYKHFTLSTLLRSVRKRSGRVLQLLSFNQLSVQNKKLFYEICRLAYEATVALKQVFSSSEIKGIINMHHEDCDDDLGLVVIDRYFMRYGVDETYTFLHLTFQEYLAAIHVAGLYESEQREIIKCYRYRNHLSVMFRFLCGMLDFSQTSAMNVFRLLVETVSDNLFQIRCGFESQHSVPCAYVISYLNGCIKLCEMDLNPSNCAEIGYVIKKADNLTAVDLTFDLCSISTEGASAFLQAVNDTEFSLQVLGGDVMIPFLEGLKHYSSCGLVAFNIANNYVGDTLCKSIREGLKNCRNLHTLILSGNEIGPIGIKCIGNVLKHCSMIKVLDLYNNNIKDTGVQVLEEYLKHSSTLQTLNLGRNNIGHIGIIALGEYLINCTSLEDLSLQENSLTGAAVPELTKLIRTLTSLKALHLDHQQFTRIETEDICEAERQRNLKPNVAKHITIVYSDNY